LWLGDFARFLNYPITQLLNYSIFLCLLSSGVAAMALDRNAFTFTAYDLRARAGPLLHEFEASGRVTLRNDSSTPQRFVSLQISSTLDWKSIELSGKPAAYVSLPYTTDIDHTGSVSEAIVTLPRALEPQSTVELDIAYSGTISRDTTRLTRVGTPAEMAAATDWDQIADAFTAVRGVGYVCWYPVAMDAASLSAGSELSAIVGAWKRRHAASVMRLTLTLAVDQPVATNGRLISQRATANGAGAVRERSFEFSLLGLSPPTFAIGGYTVLSRQAMDVLYLPGHEAAAQEYELAAEKLLPGISDWFGAQREKVTIIELPEGYAPFDSGATLFTPMISGRQAVETAMAHQLAHACLESPRPWIAEGLAHFAQALVREKQAGRKAALEYMQQFRLALAEVEEQAREVPAGQSAPAEGEPLIRATDEIYYRGKAMFVWWMLRDMVGDDALQQALHRYHASGDKEPAYLQRLVEAASHRKLEWFFDDWVYRDRGLPDFRITAVFPRETLPANVMVTVTVQNDGAAGAEVPVMIPVESGGAMRRLLVPAHAKASTRITAPAFPAQVVVNDGSVPESDVSNNVFRLKP
jgi:hypothetical protein